jgi:hypothetical protein
MVFNEHLSITPYPALTAAIWLGLIVTLMYLARGSGRSFYDLDRLERLL